MHMGRAARSYGGRDATLLQNHQYKPPQGQPQWDRHPSKANIKAVLLYKSWFLPPYNELAGEINSNWKEKSMENVSELQKG